ncbi:hypothetical protein ABAC460_14800 [Asticcacaulis sp. AC460]|nr:hypothetical protein ABAC460_14800 [Asticcacaulis sp. AC460]
MESRVSRPAKAPFLASPRFWTRAFDTLVVALIFSVFG